MGKPDLYDIDYGLRGVQTLCKLEIVIVIRCSIHTVHVSMLPVTWGYLVIFGGYSSLLHHWLTTGWLRLSRNMAEKIDEKRIDPHTIAAHTVKPAQLNNSV